MKICSCEGQSDDDLRRDAARYRAIVTFVERSGAVGFSTTRPGEWTAFVTQKSFAWFVDQLRSTDDLADHSEGLGPK